jgi:hypothetical protein
MSQREESNLGLKNISCCLVLLLVIAGLIGALAFSVGALVRWFSASGERIPEPEVTNLTPEAPIPAIKWEEAPEDALTGEKYVQIFNENSASGYLLEEYEEYQWDDKSFSRYYEFEDASLELAMDSRGVIEYTACWLYVDRDLQDYQPLLVDLIHPYTTEAAGQETALIIAEDLLEQIAAARQQAPSEESYTAYCGWEIEERTFSASLYLAAGQDPAELSLFVSDLE